MTRFSMIAIAVSAHLCALRTGPHLQACAFDCNDPVSLTALISQLGAAVVLFTVELSAPFFENGALAARLSSPDHHRWLSSALPFVWGTALTVLVHLLLRAQRPRDHASRTRE